jgi:hypothetical protein
MSQARSTDAAAAGGATEPLPLRYAMLARAVPPRRALRPVGGRQYLHFLRLLHEQFRVARYIEVGARTGTSLALARGCAVAIDPVFAIKSDVWAGKTQLHLFQMTSDDFFACHDPAPYLGGAADLAFVDGLHHFEFALRDFMNCEAHCRPGGAVALHDCIPLDFAMARRLRSLDNGDLEPVTFAWAGDVWRVLRVLATWRPELRIALLDARPTGLAVVTGLDPASRVLRDNMAKILAEEEALGNTEAGWWDWVSGMQCVNAEAAAAAGALLREIGLEAG